MSKKDFTEGIRIIGFKTILSNNIHHLDHILESNGVAHKLIIEKGSYISFVDLDDDSWKIENKNKDVAVVIFGNNLMFNQSQLNITTWNAY